MKRNQYQKNEKGVNVIVELKGSSNEHHYHGNIEFDNPRVLGHIEIIGLAFSTMTIDDKLKIAKEYISKMDGFAVSNVSDGVIKVGDIIELNSKL